LISEFSNSLKFANKNFMTKKGKHEYIAQAAIANNELNPSLELLHFNYYKILILKIYPC